MEYFSLENLDFNGRKVIVRVDFNVPLTDDGQVSNDKRIKAALPTIHYLLDNGAKQVILMSHLGKPKGHDPKLTMDNVAKKLEQLIEMPVAKLDNCIDVTIPDSKIVVLENLRFHKEEKANDEAFAKKLASVADIYVNDAFGTCHRAHASVEAVTHFLPSCAGKLVQKEIDIMGKAMSDPEKPFVAIMGGVKVSDKINVIENLLKKVDYLLIGGAMMYTFLAAQGLETGKSLVEKDKIDLAKRLMENKKLILPKDTIVAPEFEATSPATSVDVNSIGKDDMGLDIGPKTVKSYNDIIKNARTVIWNGPMGKFEWDSFAQGTLGIANSLAKTNCVSIIGGGDSAAAIMKMGFADKVTHISTGGGASLEFFEGKTLPALVALAKNYEQFSLSN